MPADIRCPVCMSTSTELIECDNCQDIGCGRCMKRNQGRWIHHKCEQKTQPQDYSNVFSSMFG